MKYLSEGNYKEAILEFEKSISINAKNPEVDEMLNMLKTYEQVEELYTAGNYEEVLNLIESLQGMNRFDTIENMVTVKKEETIVKQQVSNEITSLDATIDELIANNSFDEAIELVNQYLAMDISEEQRQKLNSLLEKINQAKQAYEE